MNCQMLIYDPVSFFNSLTLKKTRLLLFRFTKILAIMRARMEKKISRTRTTKKTTMTMM